MPLYEQTKAKLDNLIESVYSAELKGPIGLWLLSIAVVLMCFGWIWLIPIFPAGPAISLTYTGPLYLILYLLGLAALGFWWKRTASSRFKSYVSSAMVIIFILAPLALLLSQVFFTRLPSEARQALDTSFGTDYEIIELRLSKASFLGNDAVVMYLSHPPQYERLLPVYCLRIETEDGEKKTWIGHSSGIGFSRTRNNLINDMSWSAYSGWAGPDDVPSIPSGC